MENKRHFGRKYEVVVKTKDWRQSSWYEGRRISRYGFGSLGVRHFWRAANLMPAKKNFPLHSCPSSLLGLLDVKSNSSSDNFFNFYE